MLFWRPSLKKSVQEEELQDQILVTTLHAFCLNIIKKAGLVSDIEEDLGTHHFFQRHYQSIFLKRSVIYMMTLPLKL